MTAQTTFFDMTKPSTGTAYKGKRLEKKLRQVRELHEQINTILEQPQERPTIHSPRDAYDYLLPFLSNLPREEFWVVVLDTRNRIRQLVKLYSGTVNQSNVRVAEVFRQAIIENAPAIIIAHNHPSGDPTPSPEDVALTRAVAEAGRLLDVEVLDRAP